MHDTWTINAQRMKGTAPVVSIQGEGGGPKAQKGHMENVTEHYGKVTRHHIVNIQVLMNVWNKAVERRDRAVFEALAEWSAFPPAVLQATLRSQTAPVRFQKAVCWNPFNIVVGPDTTWRVGDPGSGFDDLQFREFPKAGGQVQKGKHPHAQTEEAPISVARQEFNMHIERLKRINQYMGQYSGLPANVSVDDHRASMTIQQLIELLKSDVPSKYPQLFTLMRSKVDMQSAPYNDEVDTALTQTSPRRPYEFSPDRLPGALADPALWETLTTKNEEHVRDEDMKTYLGRKAAAKEVVPWVSKSYLPNIPVVQPAPQFNSSKASTVPTGAPLAVIDKPYVMLDRVQLKAELERQTVSLKARAPNGFVVLLCGSAIGTWRDCEANVSQAVNQLSGTTKLTWSAQQTPGQTMEIRIHAA